MTGQTPLQKRAAAGRPDARGARGQAAQNRVPDRRVLLIALAIFTAAFLIRLAYFLELRHSPFFDSPIMDARYNDQWARAIASGSDPAPVFFRAPLYAYFLAAIYTIFPNGFAAARIIQFLIGSLSCALVFLLGRRLFGTAAGVVAGVAAAVYGVFINFEGELLLPVLEVFVGLLLLHAVLSYWERRDLPSAFVAGALVGLFALARPNILVAGVVAAIWIFLSLRRRDSRAARAHLAAFVGGAALLVAPATLHNGLRGGDFVPVSSQGGVNFYIGNNPHSDGVLAALPEVGDTWETTYEAANDYASRAAGRPLHPSQASAYWTSRALAFMRDEPARAMGLMFRKLGYFWAAQELPNNKNLYFFARASHVLRPLLWRHPISFPFVIVGPLGVIGAVLAWRRQPRSRLLSVFVLAYMASVVPFFVNSRFRLPVVPALIIFAAYAVIEMRSAIRSGPRRRWLFPLGAAVLLAALMSTVSYGDPRVDESASYNKIGVAQQQAGRLPDAVNAFQQAVRVEPGNYQARTNLGAALIDLGRPQEAVAALEAAPPGAGRPPIIDFSLGVAWHQLGDTRQAIESFEAAVAGDDSYLEAHNNLGALYFERGDFELARAHFRRAADLDPRSYRPWFNLGLCLAQLGAHADAAAALQRSLALKPDLPAARLQLGLSLIKAGQIEEGREALRLYLRDAPANDPNRARATQALAG